MGRENDVVVVLASLLDIIYFRAVQGSVSSLV